MMNTIIASVALMATSALATGTAIVINKCGYDVEMQNTPSAGGGQSTIIQTLSPGGSYSQVYTPLTNGNGWSIKLGKDGNMNNIMQYEYTFHNDGTIWYDLSDVNGNPWNGNWEITATGSCTPRQAAYRYSTDDAYGMQSCPDSSSITVTLCSGTSAQKGAVRGEPSTSVVEEAPTSTWNFEQNSTPAASPVEAAPGVGRIAQNSPAVNIGKKVGQHHHSAPQPTTFATVSVTPSSVYPYAETVTNVHTEWVTAYVTATAAPRRHQHHPRHAHQHLE